MGMNQRGHLRIKEWRQHSIQHLDHGHAYAPGGQRLGHLHADQTTTHDHGPLDPAGIDLRADANGIARFLQTVNTPQVAAVDGRHDR